MTLDIVGSGLGQPLTINMTGPANESYFLVMSLTTGPTVTPWITLDVGFDLLNISALIPGFYGYFNGSGEKVINLFSPTDPSFDGLNLNFQNCLLMNLNTPILDKSNLYRVTFQLQNSFTYTLNDAPTAIAAAGTALLNDGTILYAGGVAQAGGPEYVSNAMMVYQPNLEAFEYLPCTLPAARTDLKAITLNNGKVLLLGGLDVNNATAGSAWLYDHTTKTVSNVGTSGKMAKNRQFFEAVLLNDGRVLILGGSTDVTTEITMYENLEKTTEIYDPVSNTLTNGPNMSVPRGGFTATKLNNGKVLVAGGVSYTTLLGLKIPNIQDSAQIYTPNAGIGSFGGNKTMKMTRGAHAAQLLPNGNVLLISGGTGTFINYTLTNACELYTTSGNFVTTGSMLKGRIMPAKAMLQNGKLIAMGGGTGTLTNYDIEATCEFYTPSTGTWTAAPTLPMSLFATCGSWVPDGSYLLTGGYTGVSSTVVEKAVVYQPE